MINEIGNHYDVFAADGNGKGEMTVRRTIDNTEARIALANENVVTWLDLDKGELKKLGEALVRLSDKMETEAE